MQKKIWLSPPHLSGNELDIVAKVFESNWLAPIGPELDSFEKSLEQHLGKPALALNSGTAAIHLALRLLGVSHGDLVLVQSSTFIGSVSPVIYQGAIPVLVDSESQSWNICPEALEKAIIACLEGKVKDTSGQCRAQKPKAIISVDLFGMPAKLDRLVEISQKYGIPLIEDAAEALGASFQGKPCGTFGDLGVVSFNGNKIITTTAGGALIAPDQDLVKQARFLSTQARDVAPHYQHSKIGYNYRMSNVLAGIGRGQMEVLPLRVQQRRANFERYREYFQQWNAKGFDIRFQEEQEGAFSNRWLSCILVDPATNKGLDRETIRLALEAENIESRPLWKPMHRQPVFEGSAFFTSDDCHQELPAGQDWSTWLFEIGLCLPSGSNCLKRRSMGQGFRSYWARDSGNQWAKKADRFRRSMGHFF